VTAEAWGGFKIERMLINSCRRREYSVSTDQIVIAAHSELLPNSAFSLTTISVSTF
jgi:hypothetical protein